MLNVLCTCGSRDTEYHDRMRKNSFESDWQVFCYTCGRAGPFERDEDLALEAWNRDQRRPLVLPLGKASERHLPEDERRGSYLPAVARHTTHAVTASRWAYVRTFVPYLLCGFLSTAILCTICPDALLPIVLLAALLASAAVLWWAFSAREKIIDQSTARSRGLGDNGGDSR